ncbi:MAG: thermonuclease family protein [Patescibacteria group bacterium]
MTKRKLKNLFFTLLFLLVIGLLSKNPQLLPFEQEKQIKEETVLGEKAASEAAIIVVKVIDGDTIEVEGKKKVRYIGINTPELHDPRKKVECFGKEAAIMNSDLVEGKEVRLEKDISETDRYGRLLRYVYIGDLFVNEYLVRQGYAYASSYPPDVKYAQQFRAAEQEARENNRGLWSECQ